MKRTLWTMLLLLATTALFAQNRNITGTLTDKDTKEPLVQTTIQLLRQKDSTFVTGAISDDNGRFSVVVPEDGNYLVKISSVGYVSVLKPIKIVNGADVALGSIIMKADAIMLKGTTVMGHATKVVFHEDTFMYNAAAYRTPEGSTIEELVKRLPGAEVKSDGTITVNGKEVKKILIDGKEFMTGDTKTALKNLPTSIVDRIKAYDQKSDLSRVTGIDDGEEQTVLDFGLKPGMHKGMFSNIDLSVGTNSRYSDRLMGAYFNDKYRFMLFANANNTNDMGFPGGGGRGNFGMNRQGLMATKMIGANFNYENKGKLKLDASLRWNHSDGDANTQTSVQNFMAKSGAYSNTNSQNYTRSNSWDGRMRLEWTPDSMTNIMFRPSFTYSTNDGRSVQASASYNVDPYTLVTNPLSAESIALLAVDSLMVNTRNTSSLSYGNNKNINGVLQYNRRLGHNGRNFTLHVAGNYGSSDSKNLSLSDVRLYQVMNALGNDSTYQTYRWNLVPTRNWGYSAEFTYSEPLWRAVFLQFSYQFQYKYTKSDRSTYDFSSLGGGFFGNTPLLFRGWDNYLSLLPNQLDSYENKDLSRFSAYKNYIHEFNLMLRVIRAKYKLNVGVMVQPQNTSYQQDYLGIHVDTTRSVVNVTPTFDFRYKFSNVSNLRINYRGTTSQPSMSQLLDVTDDSDPLNISKGNPGLKPAFTNNFRFFYNNFNEKSQRAFMTFLNYSNTRNSISNMVTYDEKTGGRIVQPQNINGNWNMMGAVMYNTPIDSAGFFNMNTFTNVGYNNYVGYLAVDRTSNSVKNTTRSLSLGERLETTYRNGWLELGLDGSLNFTRSKNQLQSLNNLNTWQFAYGGSVNVTLPWGMSVSTGLHENSRRGFSDASMNTNELVWNAQISQGFLKGKPLSVSLQFYDILNNQSNLSRAINATQRTDTWYNSVNSYAMLHVIYRLNLFGGKDARARGRRGGPDGPRDGGPGRRPGGFGGFGHDRFGGGPGRF